MVGKHKGFPHFLTSEKKTLITLADKGVRCGVECLSGFPNSYFITFESKDIKSTEWGPNFP